MNEKHRTPALARHFAILALCLSIMLLSACGKSHTSTHYAYPIAGRGDAIAATAKTQIGKSYRKGGTSPRSGFDCSGLVLWAYAQHGVSVPRTSRDQASVGVKVSRSALRPGDIVVFKTSWVGYHTGIYVGQRRFVHSPKPRTTVRFDSLDNVYWKEHFVSGRRILQH